MATYKQKFNKKYGFSKDEGHSIKEIADKAGIKYSNALKIVKKGEGAYYSNPQSVRPTVTSAREWGIARLYSAVMGGASAKVDKDLLK
jgi:transposase